MQDQKVRARLRAFGHRPTDQSVAETVGIAKHAGMIVKSPMPLSTRIQCFNVLRSLHVDKTSRSQFEIRTHQYLMGTANPTDKTADTPMKLDLPAGVDAEIKLQ